ncbi:B12-binding domain-containing protein [Tessaracoccus coleopterorum]|uniref:B12-binding domain-containing protein n=1 Tax=Tessaracoccus coleopterorum TaxID=2714950 RepID=UPI001E2EBD8B|nr:B12-binding domain-containing protein [Tessaracoccus coleopterorum]
MRDLVADGMSPSEASERVRELVAPAPSADPEITEELIASLARLDATAATRIVNQEFAARSYESAVDDWLLPAMVRVGSAWATGEITEAGEHLVASIVMRRLAAAFEAVGTNPRCRPRSSAPVRVTHELGLLAFAVALRRAGVATVYLGADVPSSAWSDAVAATGAAISITAVPRRADARRVALLTERLRATIPACRSPWVGASNTLLRPGARGWGTGWAPPRATSPSAWRRDEPDGGVGCRKAVPPDEASAPAWSRGRAVADPVVRGGPADPAGPACDDPGRVHGRGDPEGDTPTSPHPRLRRPAARRAARQGGPVLRPGGRRERYAGPMAACAARLLDDAVREGACRLEELALWFTVEVTAEVVGLTNSPVPRMARRLVSFLNQPPVDVTRPDLGRTRAMWARAARDALLPIGRFYLADVRPAIRERRRHRRDDVISHLLDEGYGTPTSLWSA